MRFELRSLQRRLKLSVLYVTHDQSEAMTLSDRIAVVHQGRLEQVGTPSEVYERPATPFVGDFLGRTVVLEGTVRCAGEGRWIELLHGTGRLLMRNDHHFSEGDKVRIISRPEDIEICPTGDTVPNRVAAKVEEVAYLGDHFEYSMSASGRCFVLAAGKRVRFEVGANVSLAFDPERFTVLQLQGDR
jgi:ABC-type Fe3+/spermidine/putrescine transport system ATPase subunit